MHDVNSSKQTQKYKFFQFCQWIMLQLYAIRRKVRIKSISDVIFEILMVENFV